MKAAEIFAYIDSFAPFAEQAAWDNSGFQVGEPQKEVRRILFALDASAALVREAADKNIDLIVTHHPFLFTPRKQLTGDDPAYLAAKHQIAVISAHTSYDCALGGVNDVLAEILGLQNIRPSVCGQFRLGEIEPQTALDFAKTVQEKLCASVSLVLPEKNVTCAAVCGGAGADFINPAAEQGADLLITGEAKHHELLDASERGISVICAGHFETEIPAVRALLSRVQTAFPQTECVLSEQRSPIRHI